MSVLMAQCLAALAFAVNVTARADIWGYVDETGATRISTQKRDNRYQLFFKGRTSAEAPDTAADIQSRAAFERTPIFHRVMDQPNAGRFEPLIEQYAKLQTTRSRSGEGGHRRGIVISAERGVG